MKKEINKKVRICVDFTDFAGKLFNSKEPYKCPDCEKQLKPDLENEHAYLGCECMGKHYEKVRIYIEE